MHDHMIHIMTKPVMVRVLASLEGGRGVREGTEVRWRERMRERKKEKERSTRIKARE